MDRKVVFITGASRGIGAATVKKFVAQGWAVAGFYNCTKCEHGDEIKYYQLDVESPESIGRAFGQAFEDFGRVDALINCAGVFGERGLVNYDAGKMDKVYRINERGTYLCVNKILEWLTDGSIVNISSTAAFVGNPDPIYSASKAAVMGFTKAMVKELAPRIRVNAVAPGMVDTGLIKNYYTAEEIEIRRKTNPLGQIATAEDVANGIYFLASDEARHITGACLDINGGYVLR